MSLKKRKKNNQIYVVLSTSIVLFFVGLYLIGMFHANTISRTFEERVNHVVELNNQDLNKSDMIDFVKAISLVIPESVQLYNKEEAFNIMASEIDTSLISEDDHPFLDVIVFNAKFGADVSKLHHEIGAHPNVHGIYVQNIHFDQIKKNIIKMGYVFLIVAAVFSLLALALIFSTLQLQLYAHRFEIKTMELVGAEDRFIKMPYLRRAVSLATKAAVNAGIFISLLFFSLKYFSSDAALVLNISYLIYTVIILWLLGVLFLWISSNSLIQKYLSKNMADLYTQ